MGNARMGSPASWSSSVLSTELCGAAVRGGAGETCQLPPGHKGYHTTIAFTCDGCGERRRGHPENVEQYGPDGEEIFFTCFICVQADRRWRPRYGPDA